MSVQFHNEIKDVKLLLLNSIKMKFKYIKTDKIIGLLKKYYRFSEWNSESEYASCFKNFQNFLFNEDINKEKVNKIKLGNFDFTISYNNIDKYLKSEVFLFIYPDMDIVNILYNITVEDISVDELIYIRKVIQFDKTPINLKNNGFYYNYESSNIITFNDISADIGKTLIELSKYYRYAVRYYISGFKKFKLIYHREEFCQCAYESLNKQKMMVVEVRDIEGMEVEWFNDGDGSDKFSKMIYGMLVCDEGFRYVPEKSISKALEDYFSSRDYFRVYASNVGVVMINLVYSQVQRNYEEFQQQLGSIFNDENSKFICSHPDIAGLEHGALLALERATMMFVIINTNLVKEYFTSKRSIKGILKNRQKMIEIINLIMSFNINEISSLSDVIMRKMGIYNYVERVRERLDIAEDDTLIVYQKWNNLTTLCIAILGVFFAAMSISEIKDIILDYFKLILS